MARRNNYVDGKALTPILENWYYRRREAIESGTPEPPLPKEVGLAIKAIAENYVTSGKFRKVPFKDRDDLVSSGILSALNSIANSYDPAKSKTGNCFSFLTTLVWYGFLEFFKSEGHALREKNSFLAGLADGQATIGNQVIDAETNMSIKALREIVDNYNSDVERFDEKAKG